MRIWLDDERAVPEGENWHLVKTAEAAIDLLEEHKHTNLVEVISLDHDLGTIATGYDVLAWIERRVSWDNNYVVPIMLIHTSNIPGGKRMLAAISSINRFVHSRPKKE